MKKSLFIIQSCDDGEFVEDLKTDNIFFKSYKEAIAKLKEYEKLIYSESAVYGGSKYAIYEITNQINVETDVDSKIDIRIINADPE